MARGMVVGERIVSQANTEAYRENFPLDDPPANAKGGRWIWDERSKSLVRAEDYRAPERALDAPIMSDRFYEGTRTLDGHDIGSRSKRRAYMKERGLADFDDFSPGYHERQRAEQQRQERRDRHEVLVETYKQMRDHR